MRVARIELSAEQVQTVIDGLRTLESAAVESGMADLTMLTSQTAVPVRTGALDVFGPARTFALLADALTAQLAQSHPADSLPATTDIEEQET